MAKKIVINSCYGGFGLSDKAIEYFGELKNLNLVKTKGGYSDLYGHWYYMHGEICDENFFHDRNIERTDPDLIRVIEELGTDANGRFAELKIIEIPDDIEYDIAEYDGVEWVAEKHRTWR